MIKIMLIFGTRPEAIKMCPLIKQLQLHPDFRTIVCLTGQHREMLKGVMDDFYIQADVNLDIMKINQTLASITSDVLRGVTAILEQEKPDIVLVHGDTTTSYASALAAFYKEIPIGHVEAGLRTYNMKSPFPEEFNRQSVDMIADILFAPTERAEKNLLKEGKSADKIFVTGNTVIDALSTTVSKEYNHEELVWASDSRLILVTAHRRESIGEPMRNMFSAIKRIVEEYKDVKVVYPIHMNPKVRMIADEVFNNHERIHLIEPLEVTDFHNFMSRSELILTDSGGIQEEAPALGKPVLVMRDITERIEGIEAGTLKLVGTEEKNIYIQIKMLLENREEYMKMSKALNPYGDGHASERIVEVVKHFFDERKLEK